jgi:hypothetical protein
MKLMKELRDEIVAAQRDMDAGNFTAVRKRLQVICGLGAILEAVQAAKALLADGNTREADEWLTAAEQVIAEMQQEETRDEKPVPGMRGSARKAP